MERKRTSKTVEANLSCCEKRQEGLLWAEREKNWKMPIQMLHLFANFNEGSSFVTMPQSLSLLKKKVVTRQISESLLIESSF